MRVHFYYLILGLGLDLGLDTSSLSNIAAWGCTFHRKIGFKLTHPSNNGIFNISKLSVAKLAIVQSSLLVSGL